ncbi:DUF2971 domain-containing protein [Shewanella frigidimarina]|uniref:DUF2971 domain-containing protein n=1 Tax=Shewanella frigidimarina TaxID=56812 RepID=UPI003D7AB3D7
MMINDQIHWYRYEPACNNRIRKLSHDGLWISDPKTFNDPFDLKLIFDKRGDWESNSQLYLSFLRQMLNSENLSINFNNPIFPERSDIENVVNGIELSNESHLYDCINKKVSEFGVQCFSRNWNIPLSWAHYACGHRGFVIEYVAREFVLASDNPGKCHFDNVIYVNQPPEFNLAECIFAPHATLKRFLATKPSIWSYENEVRLIHYNTKGDVVDMPNGLSIDCIIMGASIEDDTKELLTAKAKELGVHLDYIITQFDGGMERSREF